MNVCPHCRTQYGPEVTVCPNDGARLGGDATPGTDPLIGTTLAERYRIIRTLGEGGMGRVYLGEHVRMGRLSAIKVMHPALAPTADAIGRFNREAANASRIAHPHVATIYDFGETADGTLYLAMEYIDGETLTRVLSREGPLAQPRTAELTRQIADGLSAAHHLGIVHRDLKPDNILLTRGAHGDEVVKVVDFGIAKSMRTVGQTLTTAGVAIGTPEYMSPEQLAGGDVDLRSDIYSLGLIVYAMLTGRLPYPEPSSKEALIQRLTAQPRRLVEVSPNRTWSPRLQQVLDRALDPEAGNRYATVREFAAELGEVIAAPAPAPVAPAPSEAKTRRMTPLITKQVVEESVPAMPPAKTSGRRPLLIVAGVLGALALLYAARGAFLGTKAVDGPQVATTTTDSIIAAPDSIPAKAAALSEPPPRVGSSRESTTKIAGSSAADTSSKRIASAPKLVPPSPRLAAKESVQATPTPTPPASVGASLSTPSHAGRHAWLRGNGDSALVPLQAPTPMAAEGREVMGHLNRAKRYFNTQEPGLAVPELRTAYEEYGFFVTEHANAPELPMFTQGFRGSVMQVVGACRVASDSAIAGGRRGLPCNNIEMAARGAGRGDALDFPGRGPRRQRPGQRP